MLQVDYNFKVIILLFFSTGHDSCFCNFILLQVEAHIEKEARTTNFHPMHNSGNNRSQDSAIDADIQEWECEVLDLDFSNSEPGDIGFDIVGGRSDPRFPNDCAIFVTNIIEGSPADGKLK